MFEFRKHAKNLNPQWWVSAANWQMFLDFWNMNTFDSNLFIIVKRDSLMFYFSDHVEM